MDRPLPCIPDYELLRRIGRGAYGEVWLARSVTGLFRAVKIIYRQQFEDARPYEREFAGIKRFEPISLTTESQVDILHVGRNDGAGYFYYVMELADDLSRGEPLAPPLNPQHYIPKTLKAILALRHRLTVTEALPIAISLADAVSHLHAHGLVHRDIKPANIIFVNGRSKLADIGLITARDASGSFVGTEGFVPREGPGTPQADIFALGKVLYEACTGRDRLEFPSLPFELERLPDRVEMGELNQILLKACDPDPKLRYRSAVDLKNDLELLRAHKSIRRLRILERAVRRGQKLAWAGSLVTLAVAFGWFQSHRFNRMAASQLARVYVKNGQERLEQNDWLGALPWFSKAMELEKGLSERTRAHQLRIANTLEWCPQLVALYTHSQPVRYAFFNSPADRVLLCEPGTAAQIWEPGKDEPITPKLEHEGQPFLGVFSPDSRQVATASRGDGAARLWDTRTGALLAGPIRHGKEVTALAFSADGQWLATAGEDGLARLWHAGNGVPADFSLHHGAPVSQLAFSSNGQRLFTLGGTNGVAAFICVWDVATGQQVGAAILDSGSITTAAFAPDGKTLASGTFTGDVCLWTMEEAPARLWKQSTDQPVLRALFNRDGSRLLVASERSARLYDSRSGQAVRPVIQSSGVLRSAEFSSDGAWFILAGESRTALIYDSQTGRPQIPLLKHGGEIYRAFFVKPGREWITASADGTVRRWKDCDGDQNRVSLRHPHAVSDLLVTPDSQRIITRDQENELRRWRLGQDTAAPEQSIKLASGITAVSLDGPGRAILTAGREGVLEAISESDFSMISICRAPAGEIQVILPNPQREQAAVLTRGGSVWLWDRRPSGLMLLPTERIGAVSQLAFSPDGGMLAAASERAVLVLKVTDSAPVAGPTIQHNDRIFHIGFSANNRRLLVSSEDRVMRWWDPLKGQPLSPAFRGDGGINFAEFSPDQERVFTTSANYDAMVWNATTGRPMTTPFKPRGALAQAAFSPNDNWLVLVSHDGVVQVWDSTSGEALTPPLATFGSVGLCRFSPNSRWLLTLEDTKTVVCRPFLPEPKPAAGSGELSALLSGYRVDGQGLLVPLTRTEIIRLAKANLAPDPARPRSGAVSDGIDH